MAKANSTLWGIHAGRTGDANELFLEHNFNALGSRYKALIPLKRVYVPESLEETE